MKPLILIIEDDPITANILENILESVSPVVVKENGLEALMYIHDGNKPALIIADLNMPAMNGYEFIAKIKSDPAYSKIPLIIVSAEDDPIVKNKCHKAGANKFITKPFDLEELIVAAKELTAPRDTTSKAA